MLRLNWVSQQSSRNDSAYILQVSGEDEQKLIEVVISAEVTAMLQKDAGKPGVSTVKVHRVLTQLSQRD